MPISPYTCQHKAQWRAETLDLKPAERDEWDTIKDIAYFVISVAIPIIGIIRLFSWAFNVYCRGHVIPSSNLSPEVNEKLRKDFNHIWTSPSLDNDYVRYPIQITTADGVKLSGTFFQHAGSISLTPTILLFQPNAVPSKYSSWWQWMPQYCKSHCLSCNFITFDYRGTGESEGFIEKATDFIIDGDAALQFAHKGLNIPSENLIVYGYSLGGVISAETLARNPWYKGKYVNDRSLWSIVRLVRSHLSCWSGPLISRMAAWHNWNLDAIEATRKISAKKLVLHHPQDPVTKPGASYAEGLKQNPLLMARDTSFVELGSPHFANPHTVPIDYCYALNGSRKFPVDQIMEYVFRDHRAPMVSTAG